MTATRIGIVTENLAAMVRNMLQRYSSVDWHFKMTNVHDCAYIKLGFHEIWRLVHEFKLHI